MAYCDVCGNFDDEYTDGEPEIKALEGYNPTLYYYWDGDICDEDYNWRRKFPDVDCMCEICFCLLYTSPSPRDGLLSRMPSSA